MAYKGQRDGVPVSRYGAAIDDMEVMGCDYWTLMEQPEDLVLEMRIRRQKRSLALKHR